MKSIDDCQWLGIAWVQMHSDSLLIQLQFNRLKKADWSTIFFMVIVFMDAYIKYEELKCNRISWNIDGILLRRKEWGIVFISLFW